MKKLLVYSVFLPCVMLCADVLYYQIPDTLTAIGYRCQLDSVYPLEADVVDDITPSGDGWQIDSVVAWFGNWNGFSSWVSVPNIHFLVYEDSVGQPADSPWLELVVQQSEYTAVLIGDERWRVDMRLPTPVTLEANEKYWIEIQPSCDTYTSPGGNIGHQAQVGIGNGQDFYMRFPLAGTPSWESATSLFGQVLETGFVLIGSELGVFEKMVSKPNNQYEFGATIIHGPLNLPEGRDCRIYDITGRMTAPDKLKPGIYFIEVDKKIVQKVVIIR